MLDFVWAGLMLISIISGFFNGRTAEVSAAIFSGAGNAVSLCISLLGCICLFSGIMEIAQKSGLSKIIAAALSPMIRLIFPRLDMNSRAAQAISLNITANLLGLGNAATPFGLTAMEELDKMNGHNKIASDYMVSFVTINTAAVQIIPTTVAMLRQKAGSAAPLEIMPCVWCASILAISTGVACAAIGNKLYRAGRGRNYERTRNASRMQKARGTIPP